MAKAFLCTMVKNADLVAFSFFFFFFCKNKNTCIKKAKGKKKKYQRMLIILFFVVMCFVILRLTVNLRPNLEVIEYSQGQK